MTRFRNRVLIFGWLAGAVALSSGLIAGWYYRQTTTTVPAVSESLWRSDLSGAPHEIIPGGKLYYLGSDTSYGYTASYAIDTSDGLIVIDPGLRFERLQSSLKSLNLDESRIKIALVTHRHADHWFAAQLVAKTGARILAHADEVPLMTSAGDLRNYYSVFDIPIPDVPTIHDVESLKDGDTVQLGEAKLTVISTPGHTPGSVCFRTTIRDYEVLFSGDTIMTLSANATDGDYMTRLGPRFGGDLQAYLRTLQRLSQLQVDVMLPGHPLLGREMDPVAGARRWKESIHTKVAVFEDRLRQHGDRMSVFLDGEAKALSDKVYYLGDYQQTACYIIQDPQGLICVDPGERPLELLSSQLQALKLSPDDIRLVLLTGIDKCHAESARALCDAYGAKLGCGHVSHQELIAESLRPDHLLNSMDELRLGELRITALAGSPSAGADLCYLIATPEHRILVGGDSVGRYPRNANALHSSVDSNLLVQGDLNASFQIVRRQDVDYVLPAHPQYDESPYYFPGEWLQRMR